MKRRNFLKALGIGAAGAAVATTVNAETTAAAVGPIPLALPDTNVKLPAVHRYDPFEADGFGGERKLSAEDRATLEKWLDERQVVANARRAPSRFPHVTANITPALEGVIIEPRRVR